MTEIENRILTGERAAFFAKDTIFRNCIFQEGESPLKESRNIRLEGCMLKWKYPLWYSSDVTVQNTTWFDMARAGVWYSKNVTVENCAMEAPKNFRRCDHLSLVNVSLVNAAETLWSCNDVRLENVTAKGDYFAMNSENLRIDGLTLYGNYSFDGVKNAEFHHCHLLSKDAFWNTENVTVYDSFISGEYLGWNARNLTLINCTVESLQGMCYIDHLVMKDCRLLNTNLAFEYCTTDADILGHIDSVKNPTSGVIRCGSIGELILEPERVDPSKTQIITEG